MDTVHYYRPYKKLGVYIKSHAILPEEWQALHRQHGPFTHGLWTEYYDGKRIYSIIDSLDTTKRSISYREILSQSTEHSGLNQERVTEQNLRLDPETWVNHFPHDHIRQKLVFESGTGYSLEILFDKVNSREYFNPLFLETLDLNLNLNLKNENIISLSYVLKTNA